MMKKKKKKQKTKEKNSSTNVFSCYVDVFFVVEKHKNKIENRKREGERRRERTFNQFEAVATILK